jgi:hypothetical protein
MTDHTLIVARLAPHGADEVTRLFAESDRGELPRRLGVRRRRLFTYQDLYFHYVEFDGSADEALDDARTDPEFTRLSAELQPFVSPYDPRTWRSPADAMARQIYTFDAARQSWT